MHAHSKPTIFLLIIIFTVAGAGQVLALKPGQVVCAKWGGSFYTATITGKSGDQWNVLYGDGDKATLKTNDIRELPWDPKLKAGDKAWAIWNNGAKFFSGTVLEVCQLSYKVKWDDGSTPSWVPATKILKR
jgi:hypothetical protein